MKLKQLAAAALFGGALIAASPAFARRRKSSPSGGEGLLQGRGRRAVRGDQEVRGKEPRHQGRAVAVRASQDMIPKTVAALDAGNPPDVAYGDVYDFQVTGQVGLRGQARGHHQHHRPDARQVRAARAVDHLPLQRRRPRRAPTTPSRSSSRPCTSSTGRTCWPSRASRKATSRRTGRATGTSGATRCSRPTARRPATRGFGTGFPMGVDSSDSFFSFLTFMDAYNVKLVNDSGKLLVDDPAVRAGPDQRA